MANTSPLFTSIIIPDPPFALKKFIPSERISSKTDWVAKSIDSFKGSLSSPFFIN